MTTVDRTSWHPVAPLIDDDQDGREFVESWSPKVGDRVRVVGGECRRSLHPLAAGALAGAIKPACQVIIGKTGTITNVHCRADYPHSEAIRYLIDVGHYYEVAIDSGYMLGKVFWGGASFAANELELLS